MWERLYGCLAVVKHGDNTQFRRMKLLGVLQPLLTENPPFLAALLQVCVAVEFTLVKLDLTEGIIPFLTGLPVKRPLITGLG